jgi:hypothetical protein
MTQKNINSHLSTLLTVVKFLNQFQNTADYVRTQTDATFAAHFLVAFLATSRRRLKVEWYNTACLYGMNGKSHFVLVKVVRMNTSLRSRAIFWIDSDVQF